MTTEPLPTLRLPAGPTRRYRITVRSNTIELRGYFDTPPDDLAELQALAIALKPFGLVIASPAEPDYNPFAAADPDQDGTP